MAALPHVDHVALDAPLAGARAQVIAIIDDPFLHKAAQRHL
jgi:hypothetical protein